MLLRPKDRREMIAGATIFMTMAYIIIINPVILSAAGIPFGPAMVATIMTAGIATLSCGLYAKRPFALAPYMGENASLVYSVVITLSVTWNVALGAVLIAGLIFLVFSFSGLRRSLLGSIPPVPIRHLGSGHRPVPTVNRTGQCRHIPTGNTRSSADHR